MAITANNFKSVFEKAYADEMKWRRDKGVSDEEIERVAEKLRAMAKELFDLVAAGVIKIEIGQTYKLKDIAQAHRDLEARKTTGSTVLIV